MNQTQFTDIRNGTEILCAVLFRIVATGIAGQYDPTPKQCVSFSSCNVLEVWRLRCATIDVGSRTAGRLPSQ